MKNILYKSFLVLAAGLMLGACEENAIEDHNNPVQGGAFIKFAHTSPTAPAVNFYLNSSKISGLAPTASGEEQGLSFTTTSVFPSSFGYSNVPAGTHNLQAISPAAAGGAVVAQGNVALAEGGHYTAFLLGLAEPYETLLVESKMPEANYSRSYIRVVNVAENAPSALDAVVVRTATSETAETRTPIGNDVSYKGQTDYVAIDAQGSYVMELAFEGAEGPVVLKSASFSPIAGRVYTLIVRGDFATAAGSLLIRDR